MAFTPFKSMQTQWKFIMFFVMMFVFMALSTIVGALFLVIKGDLLLSEIGLLSERFGDPEFIPQLEILNVFNQIGTFLVTPLVFVALFGKQCVDGLMLTKPKTWVFILAPLFLIACLPIIDWSWQFNQFLIPEGSVLFNYFNNMEEQAMKLTEAMMVMPDRASLIKNLIIVALIPAVCEEIAFRGVFQSLATKMTRNVHLGIWISAFIFSAIHLQFLSFFPRFILGAMFGYLLVHTGSIITPIIAHFVNNGYIVVLYYLQQHSTLVSVEDLENGGIELGTAASFTIILIGLIYLLHKNSAWKLIKSKYLVDSDGELAKNSFS